MVAVPLAVVAGETAPHDDAEHDTVHGNAFIRRIIADHRSQAYRSRCLRGGGVRGNGDGDGSWDSLPPLLPPPQPAIAIVKTSPSHAKAENVDRFTTPPFGQPEWRAAIRTIALNDDA